ncbi:hypothetical protein DID77_02745 [Candidatus Marinamargulisbacteria bacterium SCGC AG-439-L15]|nr:hypothetical protein DID77_02745 [Candidatus Marinamargulisbacteria bacterium SCGC AG-439-L15]
MLEKVKTFFGFEEELEAEESATETVSVSNGPEHRYTFPDISQSKPVINGFKGSLVTGKGQQNLPPSEIKIEEPRIYEDSLQIAAYLREKKPVIVNLKHLDATTGKRLIDFVCGTAYAINGHMMKIGENIFLFTPDNILIVDSEKKSTFEQGLQQETSHSFLSTPSE